MSDCSCGAMKLNSGPDWWIKTSGFTPLDFGLRIPKQHIHGPIRSSWIPG